MNPVKQTTDYVYSVKVLYAPALSFWILPLDSSWTASSNWPYFIGFDTITNLYGMKFNGPISVGSTVEFTLSVSGNFNSANITGVSYGTSSSPFVVKGPVSIVTYPPPPSEITITATIFDFLSSHSDFHGKPTIAESEIVKPAIGSDGTPTFNPPLSGNSRTTVTNSSTFYDWFHPKSNSNKGVSWNLKLNKISNSPPLYNYYSDSFFPIDGSGLGNEGYPHNYLFTMQAHTGFTYRGGESLTFVSADDMWIFINEKLVADLGGLHAAKSATVNLDTLASSLSLTSGSTYQMDLFFGQRHTNSSMISFDMSIGRYNCELRNFAGDCISE